ncbi:HNH endonuclease [Mesobacterium pallidum]|uniref:HNH endonuclease n=1 Tax=Mesobacterium pallidum TaxID=2872037 RepID=UPI001EE18B1A|nr:HNH endonuclease [Mesobacterium pallidum]
MHKPDSVYEDELDTVYDFPRRYLKAVTEAVGDWVVYFEPVKAGTLGYFAVAKIAEVVPKPGAEGRFLALVEPGTFLNFDQPVPRQVDGRMMETSLVGEDGRPLRGGLTQSAVRRLPDADFARIVNRGLPQDLEAREARRYAIESRELAEDIAPFERPVLERLTRRPFREVAFRRRVREAYDYCCALSGLQLRNGGGRPEVQAAHIRPVERQGSDSVRKGLALSSTLHWMFDRGLISVAEDCRTILLSENKVPRDVADRLIVPDRKLRLPSDRRDWPHPANLRWHRENVFGQHLPDDPPLWG